MPACFTEYFTSLSHVQGVIYTLHRYIPFLLIDAYACVVLLVLVAACLLPIACCPTTPSHLLCASSILCCQPVHELLNVVNPNGYPQAGRARR